MPPGPVFVLPERDSGAQKRPQRLRSSPLPRGWGGGGLGGRRRGETEAQRGEGSSAGLGRGGRTHGRPYGCPPVCGCFLFPLGVGGPMVGSPRPHCPDDPQALRFATIAAPSAEAQCLSFPIRVGVHTAVRAEPSAPPSPQLRASPWDPAGLETPLPPPAPYPPFPPMGALHGRAAPRLRPGGGIGMGTSLKTGLFLYKF